MEKRLKFLPGQQKKFLLKIQETSGLHSDILAKFAGVVPRSYRDWKREKFHISARTAELFCKKFNISLPEDIKKMKARWEKHKREIAKRGGEACFKKYGSPATPEGRKKGGTKTLKILRERGIIPAIKKYRLPEGFNEDLAEYVGILLGDGGITTGQVCVTLNSEKDKDYINFVVDLENKLFKQKPKVLFRKNMKAANVYLNGIQLVNYLIKIGLKVGNKVRQQVDVPEWIKISKKFRIACLRGLMDTDGGIFLHRYKVNGKLYIYKKICFTNRSLPLLNFVRQTLLDLNLTPKIITKVENKKVWLYNGLEVKSYYAFVGSHNQRLLRYRKVEF